MLEIDRTPAFEDRKMLKGMPEWMPEVIVPQTTIGLRSQTKRLNGRIQGFQEKYLEKHPTKSGDERIKRLFEDMNTAGYWHWLGQIDGYDVNPHNWSDVYSDKKLENNREIRGWAVSTFSQEDLRQMLAFGIEMALSGIHSDVGQPGFKHGHTMIYSHLFEKPESMFSDLATKALKKRLNNGRFWENVAEISYIHRTPQLDDLEDVLTNHAEDLDVDFFSHGGYEIFKRNGGEHANLVPDLSLLSADNLDAYWEFVKKIDANELDKKEKAERGRLAFGNGNFYIKPSQTDSQVAYLVRPYLNAIHSRSRQNTFEQHLEDVKARLGDPVLQKYLAKTDLLRKELAKDLLLYVQKKDDYEHDDKLNAEYVAELLHFIPRPREMLTRMMNLARRDRSDYRHYQEAQLEGLRKVFRITHISIAELLQAEDSNL